MFIPALATVIKAIDLSRLPQSVLDLYKPFLASYKVQEPHKTEHLKHIFYLT